MAIKRTDNIPHKVSDCLPAYNKALKARRTGHAMTVYNQFQVVKHCLPPVKELYLY
jgi:hypothetical protein